MCLEFCLDEGSILFRILVFVMEIEILKNISIVRIEIKYYV